MQAPPQFPPDTASLDLVQRRILLIEWAFPSLTDGCPVNRSLTIRRYASLFKVHAIVGVCAPPCKPAAGIPTVAWTNQT